MVPMQYSPVQSDVGRSAWISNPPEVRQRLIKRNVTSHWFLFFCPAGNMDLSPGDTVAVHNHKRRAFRI